MTIKPFFPIFIALAVASGPQAFAHAPSVQPVADQVQPADADPCLLAQQQAKAQSRKHAIFGLARTLASALPMTRGVGMLAAAGQVGTAALDTGAAAGASRQAAACTAE